MPTIRSILEHKPRVLHTISADATVHDAACLMNEHRIGALVVVEQGRMCGIFTERDILTRVVGPANNPSQTPVHSVMTDEVLTSTPETKVREARAIMRDRRIRHLPVLEGDELVGMLSIGDLNLAENLELEQTIQHMEVLLNGNVF